MASAAASFPAVDRNDVHRSAKALEQVNTLFHDYCHATSVTATVQKKLAKALKEASNVKGTHPTAANMFGAAAIIFEGVGEVQNKFAKICEREYETLSSELKKWFKKMNKEDRQHDELVYSLQAKLKSTTQGYEKKVKGRFMESTAASDHSQYINTLNNLTSELSQSREAYSESLSTKHIRILLVAGGAVGRVGTGEWVRCCESVRRAGVAIAKVDEWRAYCEIPFAGTIPDDLPDIDEAKPGEQSPVDSYRTGGRASLDAARLNNVVEEAEVPPSPATNRVNGRNMPSAPEQPVVENADGLRAPVPEPIRTDSPRAGSSSPRPLPVVPSPNGPPQHLFPPAPTAQVPPSTPPAASSATASPTLYPVSPPAYVNSPPAKPSYPPFPLPPQPEQLPVQDAYPFPEVGGRNSSLQPPDPEDSQLKSPPQTYSVTESTVSTLVQEETPRPPPTATPKSPLVNSPPKADTYRSAFRRESYGRLADAIESPRPTHAFVPPPLPPPLSERTTSGRVTRSNSIESTRSANSHVAAMRERYGGLSLTSPQTRDAGRMPAVSSVGSRAAASDAFGVVRTGPPPSAFASPATERTSTRKPSFEFGERDKIRDRTSDPDSRERPRASLPARDRDVASDRPWNSHTRQRSRDWPDEQDIQEDRDREGTRRRREEDLATEERMNLLRDRERELERREKEIGRREQQQQRGQDYVGDRDRRDVPVTPGRRDREWDRPRDREYDPRNGRSQEPLSPTPRRTYSPPSLYAASRSTNALQQSESSGSKGHASTCGCHDCSAKLYAMPSPRGNPPPQERPERNENGDRQRYLSSNDRFASSTVSLSNTSPNISRTSFPQMKSTPGTPGDSSGTETDSRKAGARRSVFANLRRLSMGGGFSGASDANSGTAKATPTPSTETAPPSVKWKHSPSTIPESEEPSSRPLSMVRGGLR